MKNKLTLIFVILFFFSFGWYFYHIKQRENEISEAKRTAELATFQAALAKLRQHTNASLEWEDDLAKGQSSVLRPFLTVELEKVWLTREPILFIGHLSDVATHDSSNYIIKVDYERLRRTRFFSADLRLELVCNKQIVDPILSKLRVEKVSYFVGVAVAGKIEKIKSDGGFFSGIGECIDLIYLSNTSMLLR